MLLGLFNRAIGHSSLCDSHMIVDYVSPAYIKLIDCIGAVEDFDPLTA
jgi:hypothetical protein